MSTVMAILLGLLAVVLVLVVSGTVGGLLLKMSAALVARVEVGFGQAFWLALLLLVVNYAVGFGMLLLAGGLGALGSSSGSGSSVMDLLPALSQLASVPISALLGAAIVSSKLGISFGRALLVLIVMFVIYMAFVLVIVLLVVLAVGGFTFLQQGGTP